jgi:hypothetical protein
MKVMREVDCVGGRWMKLSFGHQALELVMLNICVLYQKVSNILCQSMSRPTYDF